MKYKPQPERVIPRKILRESDARIVIDRRLREAGWDIEDKNQVTTEEPTKTGRADYLFKDRRGRPLGIIEAKRFSIDPEAGKQQALEYAEELKVEFIFLSNGEDIYFWDWKAKPEQKVATFFSQKDLEKLYVLRKSRKPLSVIPIPDEVFVQGETRKLRSYQKEAIQMIDKNIETGKRKMLVVMATGTGKTLTVAVQIKRLFEAGLIERVLFLVDRIELGKQAQETFNDCLKDYPSELLFGGRQKKESLIIIGTLPTIYSQLDNFTSGYFDLVISDEAHRSIYSVYNAVLTHFDAIEIGLTATPSMFIDRNTYKLFDCWNELDQRGSPDYVYGIRRGIKEGYLAGYDICRINTKISLEGIKYEGEDYNPEDLERKINVPARNEQIVKAYKEEEEKRTPKRHRKAIIYAVTQKHAAQLSYYFNQAYLEFKGRYAEVITSNVPDVDRAIKRFKQEELPYIAVSVGMLDTGFDCPEAENIVMVRPTNSPILYQQMRGRGSRLSKKIGKTSFRLYDFVKNTETFNDEGYNPYSEIATLKRGIPWGTEEAELTEEEKQKEMENKQWPTKKLGEIITEYFSGTWGEDPNDSGNAYVFRVSDIKSDFSISYDSAPLRKIKETDLEKYKLRPNDIIVVKSSGNQTKIISGRAALFDYIGKKVYAPSNFLITLRPNQNLILPIWLWVNLNSSYFLYRIGSSSLICPRIELQSVPGTD